MYVSLEKISTNFAHLYLGDLDLYFSYNTIIGFMYRGKKTVCRNEWGGSPTGKHINALEPNKNNRVDRETFYKELRKLLPNL